MRILIAFAAFAIFILINFTSFSISHDLKRYLNVGLIYIISFNFIFPLIKNFRLKSEKYTLRLDLMDLLIKEHNTSLEVYSVKEKLNSGCITFNLFKKNVIVLSEELEQKLTEDELKFILFHELYHIIKHHSKLNLLSLVITVAIIPITIYFAILFGFSSENMVLFIIISVLFYISGYILHFKTIMQREFKADQYALGFSGQSAAQTLFEKLRILYGDQQTNYNLFNTHPSMQDRIEKLSFSLEEDN